MPTLGGVALHLGSRRFLLLVRIFSWFLAAYGLAGAALPAAAQTMSLPAKFDVTAAGAATYSIPISAPPGTAGMAPSLALTYNSQAGNGIIGVGWSLEGLPAVGRCPQTIAQDGVAGGVNYNASDRFCLDGQRLVAVSGAYGADGTQYRTEVDSYSLIISHGSAGTGPAWFEVHTKTGQVMQFGDTPDSQLVVPSTSTVRGWSVNKVSDTKGNYFTVTYTNDTTNGQAYPSQINYTANAGTGLAAYNSVQFVYTTRPDITPGYHAGIFMQTTVLLTDVKTYAGTTMVGDYKLAYQQVGTIPVSALTSVTLCAGDGTCLPPTTFAFSGGVDPGLSGSSTTSWTGNASGSLVIAGDYNGDGKTDYVVFTNNTGPNGNASSIATFLSNGDGTFEAVTSTIPYAVGGISQLVVGDFNGDGKGDFLFFGSGPWLYSFISNGDGTFTAGTFDTGIGFQDPMSATWGYFVGDFNGDGRTDFAYFGGNTVGVLFSNGDGTFSEKSFIFPNGWNFGYPAAKSWMPILGDFNGDGKTDFAVLGGTQLFTFLSNGDGTFTSALNTIPNGWNFGSPAWQSYEAIAGDFNGDGQTDFLLLSGTQVFTFLSVGDGTFATSVHTNPNSWNFGSPPSNYPVIVGDFNGDGKSDYVLIGSGGFYKFLSNGNGTFQGTLNSYPNGWNFNSLWPYLSSNLNPTGGDFNGDGKADILFVPSSGSTSATQYSLLSSGSPTPQLTSISTGLGATTTVTYQPLTNNSIYNPEEGGSYYPLSYPMQHSQAATYVVTQVNTSDGIGGIRSTAYNYSGGKTDVSGRGFLGFRQMTETDLQTNAVETTTFLQSVPYLGLVASKTKAIGAQTLSQSSSSYQFINASGTASVGANAAPYQVSLVQTQTSSSDLDGSPLPTASTSFQYDAYGNATQITATTSDGFSKTTTNNYTNDTVNWFLGRLTNATVTSQAGVIPQPPPASTSGSQTYTTPGTYTFTVPAYNALTVTVKGAGGGSGSSSDSTGPDGAAGGVGGNSSSTPSTSASAIVATGGGGGSAGGTDANGNSITSTPGYNGAGIGGSTNTIGGGGAGATVGTNNYAGLSGGPGGAGGLAQRTWASGAGDAPAAGTTFTVVVGAGGIGPAAPSGGNGGAGANGGNGLVSISWTGQSGTTPASCELPWSGTINNGTTVTAYASPSVPSGQTCQSQSRTCNYGALTGTYTYQSCSASQPGTQNYTVPGTYTFAVPAYHSMTVTVEGGGGGGGGSIGQSCDGCGNCDIEVDGTGGGLGGVSSFNGMVVATGGMSGPAGSGNGVSNGANGSAGGGGTNTNGGGSPGGIGGAGGGGQSGAGGNGGNGGLAQKTYASGQIPVGTSLAVVVGAGGPGGAAGIGGNYSGQAGAPGAAGAVSITWN